MFLLYVTIYLKPMKIFLPPESQITFESKIPIHHHKWTGTPEITINWTFHYYKKPYPKGELKIILPDKK